MKGWADLEATCSWLFWKNNIKHFQDYRLCIMSFDLYVQGHSLGGVCNKDYVEEKKLEKEAFEKKIGLLTYVGQSAIESRGRCYLICTSLPVEECLLGDVLFQVPYHFEPICLWSFLSLDSLLRSAVNARISFGKRLIYNRLQIGCFNDYSPNRLSVKK